ncbi:hypothetical protein QLH51_10150 [Sphingomonas sp. 2R-10]|uniref:hypothetical protein n=1 Tax=Sphingomonas sp. 2R-10 TaxID=3045148 RepID=UPI000F7B617E|nr:hypothetical protein [Sphingomonas sp. 2R-10]MDJ0277154.1 hypothetical protein [Sphingomonas sp. 2R-10]
MAHRRALEQSNLRHFGAAHAARSLGWSVVDLLFAWHLHVNVGLTGVETGWSLFLMLGIGGVATLLAGFTLSRRIADGPTIVRVQVPATIAAAILLCVTFQTSNAFLVIAAGAAFRIVYAVQDIAQNMLTSLLPTDDRDADRYARLRVTLSAGARCCVVTAFAVSVSILPAMLAVIATAAVASAISLRRVVFPRRPDAGHRMDASTYSMPAGLARLLLSWAVAAMLLPTLNRLLIFSTSPPLLPRSGVWLLAGFCVGSMIGPLWKHPTAGKLLTATILSALSMIVVLPGGAGLTAHVIGAVFHGVALSVFGVQLWGATARLAMTQARTGYRADGIIFGSVILTLHFASAAGMLVVGPLIEGVEAARLAFVFVAVATTVFGALLLTVLGLSERTAPAAA